MVASARATWRAVALASLAVGIGCLLLVSLDAPARMPIINGAAFLVGMAASAVLLAAMRRSPRTGDLLLCLAGAVVPLVALLGERADGVARWVVLSGLTIQPALIMAPLVAVGFASSPRPARAAAVAVAATGCVLQPDLGAASMLASGVTATALVTRSGQAAAAAVIALAGVALCAIRPVSLPPVPFVEQIVPTAFAAGAAPTILALGGIAAMFLPAVILRNEVRNVALAAWSAAWAGGLVAALLGPYPTPVIGFGGSAVVGYIVSAALAAQVARQDGRQY